MATKTECRRCSECRGCEHHWLPNPELGDEEAPEEMQHVDYICKHCAAIANACGHCFGDGDEPGLEDLEPCSYCNGEGVVQLNPTARGAVCPQSEES